MQVVMEPTQGSDRHPVRVEGGHGAACLVRPRPQMPLLPSYRALGLCMKFLLQFLHPPPCSIWRPRSASTVSARLSLFKILSGVLVPHRSYLAWNEDLPQLRSLPERPVRLEASVLPRLAQSETRTKRNVEGGSLPTNVQPRHACGVGSRSCGV